MSNKLNNIDFINDCLDKADMLYEEGDIDKALEIYQDAWFNGFIQPPYQNDIDGLGWCFCYQITAIFVEKEQYEEAIKWAVNLIKFPDRNYDDDYIVIGEIYLKMNKLDLAFEMFDKAYKSGKARAFKEHDDAWEFYKNYPTTKQV